MRALWRSALAVGLILQALVFVMPASAQGGVSCADYDAWEWAQAVFDSDPNKYDALDPDNDGVVCPELPRGGFAPAIWTDEMPKDVDKGRILRVIDGDTFEVEIGGVSKNVRIYRADTPEVHNKNECGGQQATDYATWALSWNDTPGIVYIEKDKTSTDKYGRELAYIWFTVDGHPYMLNHILINNGYAADKDYGDRKYDTQFKDAAAFGKRHELGVWELCGGFGVLLKDAPAAAQVAAQQSVLTQQGGSVPVPVVIPQQGTSVIDVPVAQQPVYEEPAPPVYEEPVYEEPAPAPVSDCDPNYTPCVPNVSYDLNCPDIGFMVTVIGYDRHGFDRDKDGRGCESYG